MRLVLCIHFPKINVESGLMVAPVREEKGGVCKYTGHVVNDKDAIMYIFGISKVSDFLGSNF